MNAWLWRVWLFWQSEPVWWRMVYVGGAISAVAIAVTLIGMWSHG